MTKKNIIFLSISLVLIILLGIGVSYSMWSVSVSQDTNNTAYTECFDLSITNKENNINLDNAYPISNDKGKSLTPYTFTVTNTCDITAEYSVNLEVLNNSTLASKFIDVMFEGNINLLSSYDSTDKVNTNSIESRKLITGILKSQESKDYSLRLWIDYNTTLEDLNNEIKSFKSKIVVVGKPINYTGDTVFNFDYTGGEQTFTAPVSGTYKLETWGAQGGSYKDSHNVGGYSIGDVALKNNDVLFINVGGSGTFSSNDKCVGGYNGGGIGYGQPSYVDKRYFASGGGATHIATQTGLLNDLEKHQNNILIVSGGGGGSFYDGIIDNGGGGGGVVGVSGVQHISGWGTFGSGGTQNAGGYAYCDLDSCIEWGMSFSTAVQVKQGKFGKGADSEENTPSNGGGGGYYGGGASSHVQSAGGGSGYIGNSSLTNKTMYCYNCEESNEESTKTISTTCNEETPTSYCAKKGNGYARITLVSIDE